MEPQNQETFFRACAPIEIQISLRIRAVWSESSLSAFWIATFLHADNENPDAQADLNLRWAHVSEGRFSLDEAQFIFAL